MTEQLVRELQNKIKQAFYVQEQENIDSIMGNEEKLAVVTETMSKFNLYMSNFDIISLMKPGQDALANLESAGSDFLSSSSKWAIMSLA